MKRRLNKNARYRYLAMIGRHGIAALFVFWFMPAAAWPGALICGFPAGGRVAISRAQQPLAEFAVARAQSIDQRRQGLMNCARLEPGTGMLFIYADDRPRTFWMKDTPLELGIIFIDGDGRIMSIARGIPGSREPIRSPGPVRYVLEINYAEARTLQVGDRMRRIAPDATRQNPDNEGQP